MIWGVQRAAALLPLLQQSGDVSFSAAAIAIVTALLGVMASALGMVAKLYLATVRDQVADLRGQILSLQKDLEYERGLRENTIAIAETTAIAYRGLEQSNRPPGRGSPHA